MFLHPSLYRWLQVRGRAGIDVLRGSGARGRGCGRTGGSRVCGLEGAHKVDRGPGSSLSCFICCSQTATSSSAHLRVSEKRFPEIWTEQREDKKTQQQQQTGINLTPFSFISSFFNVFQREFTPPATGKTSLCVSFLISASKERNILKSQLNTYKYNVRFRYYFLQTNRTCS